MDYSHACGVLVVAVVVVVATVNYMNSSPINFKTCNSEELRVGLKMIL